jgi:hypothetical protein
MALRALLLLAAGFPFVPDITPRATSDPVLAAEKLGNSFQSKGPEEDRGLKVSVWWNLTLEREERWHCTENGEWFFRARPNIFVLTETEKGGWVTRPLERIVNREGKWRRISLPEKR